MNFVPLEELSESVEYGVTASASDSAIGPKFLRITDIQNGAVDWQTVPYCTAPTKKLEQSELRPGDIVFARTGATTGKSYLIRECPARSVFASYLIRVRPNNKVDPLYLSYFFDSPDYWTQIKAKSQGAAQPGVNSTKLKEILVPLPPLDEQRQMAEILDQAHALLRSRELSISLLDGLGESIFREMFGDSDGLPEQPLEAVAKLKRGPFGGALKKEIFVPNGYKVYEQSHAIQKDHSIGRYYIDDKKFGELKDFSIERDDLIVSCSGTLGRVYRIPEGAESGVINQALLRVRPNQDIVLPEYLEFFLETPQMQEYLTGFSRGTGLKNFPPMSEVRRIPVPLPPKSVQKEFLRRIRTIDEQRVLFWRSKARVNDLFASIQQRAFRGEL